MKINRRNVKLSSTEKIMLLSSLSTMMTAGISISEAVESLMEDSTGNYRYILECLKADLDQGKRVYEAFLEFPGTFDEVTINIIKASEEAGILDSALKNITDSVRKQVEFLDRVKFALIYPAVVLVIFFAIFSMILFFVIPKFATVFTQLKIQLPLPTKVLFILSETIIKNPLMIGLGFIIIAGAIILLYVKKKSYFVNFFISLPIINNLVRQIDLARFTFNLHLLLRSGIAINVALELCQNIVVRKDIREIISKSKKMVISGKKLSESLKTTKHLIPTVMIKLIEAGENSGTLVQSMSDISTYLDYEVVNTLKAFTALLEPILLVFVGLVVGGMMVAIISPIYQLIGQIGGQ